MYIKKYNEFLILEKFDDNIRMELIRLGVTDPNEINKHLYHAHRGYLSKYLEENGRKFTFGMLNALFKDSMNARKRTGVKIGIIKAVHRILPMTLSSFFPFIAIVGYILGSSRAFNKVITPILSDPCKDYPDFLKKIIDSTMKIAEGDVTIKDRFTRAFVVSDGIVDILDKQILNKFSIYLSDKMSKNNLDDEVPENYIENELKMYLNNVYNITPSIPLK